MGLRLKFDVEVIDYGQLELMVVRASASHKIARLCPQLSLPGWTVVERGSGIPGPFRLKFRSVLGCCGY